ncbi:phage antirepressor KilAC domain-containing protein [Heliobacterium chlorum]|uniref:Phage antirepressor KilAC domain-containing protein n=1 Tax=Heliobacterium chlorum TaxID=2698 RepID=A0ABR7T8U3_HELCL|nr:phage antirepressor KilAC domain-containing protein [Heliobacterium chlorum]MBC9786445.1 phage antirepressor KilAC domain-containing protein [Heliobacterium chlorum]
MTNLSFQVIEQQGQRVLTTAQLAEVFEADTNTLTVNFHRNKQRFTPDKHFFFLDGAELKEFKGNLTNCNVARNLNRLYLWTEKGAWLHAKSLNTDRAWDAYEKLVDEYYRLKEQAPRPTFEGRIIPQNYVEALDALVQTEKMRLELVAKVEANAPKVKAFDTFIESHGWQTMSEVAKSMDEGRNGTYEALREEGILIKSGTDKNLPLQRYIESGHFMVKEYTFFANGQWMTKGRTMVSPKGVEFIRQILQRRKGVA